MIRLPKRRITCRKIVTPKAPGVLKQYGAYRNALRHRHGESEVLVHDIGMIAYALFFGFCGLMLVGLLAVGVMEMSR